MYIGTYRFDDEAVTGRGLLGPYVSRRPARQDGVMGRRTRYQLAITVEGPMTKQTSTPGGPIILLIAGTMLNATGIALVRSGPMSYVLMGVGVLLLLIALLRLLASQPTGAGESTRGR